MIKYRVIYNMSGERIKLQNPDNRRRQEEEEQETDFGGGSDENDLIDYLDWLKTSRVNIDINNLDPRKKLLVNRVYEARNIGFFIKDVVLMGKECTNPRFINYLMKKLDFPIIKTLRVLRLYQISKSNIMEILFLMKIM